MRLLTIQEVAQRLGVRVPRAYELVRLGMLPAVRIGRNVRVAEDRLEEWIRAGGQGLQSA